MNLWRKLRAWWTRWRRPAPKKASETRQMWERVQTALATLETDHPEQILPALRQVLPPNFDPSVWRRHAAGILAADLEAGGTSTPPYKQRLILARFGAFRAAGGDWLPAANPLIVTLARERQMDPQALWFYCDYLAHLHGALHAAEALTVAGTLQQALQNPKQTAEQQAWQRQALKAQPQVRRHLLHWCVVQGHKDWAQQHLTALGGRTAFADADWTTLVQQALH